MDVVVLLLGLVELVAATICPAIDGKRGDALVDTLMRDVEAVAAKATGITEIIVNKLTVLMMFFISILHAILFYFITDSKIIKAKNEVS